MDLEHLLARYQAPPEAAELIEATRPVKLLGPSGSGKNALADMLEESGEYVRVVSHTTRPLRINNGVAEREGVDYHPIGKGFARSMLFAHSFVEAHFVHGEHLYGTSLDELRKVKRLGKRALMDIDIQGADDYERLSHAGSAIFLLPPDIPTWRGRLLKRYGSEDELMNVLPRRFRTAHTEITMALDRGYLRLIANADLAQTALVASRIIAGEPYDDSSARAVGESLADEIEAYLREIGEPIEAGV